MLDYDGVSPGDMVAAFDALRARNLSFEIWRSSDTGFHIHLLATHSRPLRYAFAIAAHLYNICGITADMAPMKSGKIRAEWSIHPIKKTQKVPWARNLSLFKPLNLVPERYRAPITPKKSHLVKGGLPKSVQKLEQATGLSDGRDRCIFALISWWKQQGLTDSDILSRANEWAGRQNNYRPHLACKVRSARGLVTEQYRQALIDELGL